jgi:hypothetical protein
VTGVQTCALPILKAAPHATFVSRLDETRAARRPILRWTKPDR